MTSSSDPVVGTVGYDAHGNTTTIFGESHGYDAADRHVTTTKGSTSVVYTRDGLDRIVARTANGVVEAGYIFGGAGDAADGVINSANQLLQADVSLPGGVLLAVRPSGGNVWSYPNVHGDLVAAANQSGAKPGATVTFDPYGAVVGSIAPGDNSPGSFDYGYLGQHQRPVETQSGLQPMIEMGARQYSPLLGRFLEVDPIPGGSANNYDYVNADPINDLDLDGNCPDACVVETGVGVWVAGAAAVGAAGWLVSGGRRQVTIPHVRLPGFSGAFQKKVGQLLKMAEHKRNARKSAEPKHQKGKARAKQKQTDKKRQHDGWKNRQ